WWSRRAGSVGGTPPSRLSRAVRVDGTPRRSSSTSSRSSPPPHLAKARLLVVRDALEDLQGRGSVVAARLQRGRVPRQVDRPLAEGQVLVARFAGSPVIVVDVRQGQPVSEDREVLAGAVRPRVVMGVADAEAMPQVRARSGDLSQDGRR